MSESKAETSSTTAANAPSPSPSPDPNQQWSKFYIQACALLTTTKEQQQKHQQYNNNNNEEEIAKNHQRIMITLDTITKLIFGLSANRKAQVVVHGGGALELIVALVRTSQVLQKYTTPTALSKPIIISSLKAIKICVLRNPAGRCRCRTAGVLLLLRDILEVIVDIGDESESKVEDIADVEDKLLVEHVFTTLAAICLGDDLNALQV